MVKDDKTLAQPRIPTGPWVETGWAVTHGLQGGEQVVSEGAQRLQNGMTVTTATAPAAQGGDATESTGDAP